MGIPVTAMTLDEIALRVAERLAIANYRTDGTSYLPVDSPFNLAECVKFVNRGIRLLIDSAPVEGWRWMKRMAEVTFVPATKGTATTGTSSTLTCAGIAGSFANDYFNGYVLLITAGTGVNQTGTITDYVGSTGQFIFGAGLSLGATPDSTSTFSIIPSMDVIDNDPARYMLPTDFGGEVTGKISYAKNSNIAVGISWADEYFLRERRSTVVKTGIPYYAAILPYQPTSSVLAAGRRWQIMFDPEPSQSNTVEFPYTLNFDGLRLFGGTADSASTTGLVDANLTALFGADNDLNGWVCEIVDGTGRGSYATITDYTAATGTIVVSDWLSAAGTAGGVDPSTDSKYLLTPTKPLYHPAGFMFDGIIETACLAACEIYGGDRVSDTHYTELFYQKRIPDGFRINNLMRPRHLGKMTDGPAKVIERTWTDVSMRHNL